MPCLYYGRSLRRVLVPMSRLITTQMRCCWIVTVHLTCIDGDEAKKTQVFWSAAAAVTVFVAWFVAENAAPAGFDVAAVKQASAQHLPAALHPGFCAGKGKAQTFGYLFLRQILKLREDKGGLIDFGQVMDKRLQTGRQLSGIVAFRFRGRQFLGKRKPRRPGSVMIDNGIGGKAVQPGSEAAGGFEGVQAGVRFEEDLLEDVVHGIALPHPFGDIAPQTRFVFLPEVSRWSH